MWWDVCHGVSFCSLPVLQSQLDAIHRSGVRHVVIVSKMPLDPETERRLSSKGIQMTAIKSITSQLQSLLLGIHRAVQKGIGLMVVCENGRQRAPAVVAAYLLWQTQLPITVVMDQFRTMDPSIFSPSCVYDDVLRYVAQRRAGFL
jgi:hypothetical protein